MTAPTTGAASVAQAAVTAAKTSRNPLMVALSLAATVAAGAMIKDSYEGTKIKRSDASAAILDSKQYHAMEYGWGMWSGTPGMEHWAHKAHHLKAFGPMNLFLKWKQFKSSASSIVNDVILPNMIPIAVGIGGLYAGFGSKAIHGVAKAVVAPLKHVKLPATLAASLKSLASKGLSGLSKGLGKGISKMFSSPKNLLMSLGGLAFGGFALNRFQRVYTREADQDYFREFVTTQHTNH